MTPAQNAKQRKEYLRLEAVCDKAAQDMVKADLYDSYNEAREAVAKVYRIAPGG